MCTAISNNQKYHLFGRTLDVECSYGESVVITPAGFHIGLIYEKALTEHSAIIGVALVKNGMPLYYDAVNEHGLAIAALNFPRSAVYNKYRQGMYNIASFELIPWVLCKCRSTDEAARLLANTNITDDSFSDELPATPLHWMISDRKRSIVAEPLECGLRIYDDRFGVLTNEPPFSYHAHRVADFLHISPNNPSNDLYRSADIEAYSNGLGAVGLPGDFSSSSRFVRAVFLNRYTESRAPSGSRQGEICRFFHIMDSLCVPYGAVKTGTDANSFTVYTSCADTLTKTYYFSTYNCRGIRAVKLGQQEADASELSAFSMDGEDYIINP